MTRVT